MDMEIDIENFDASGDVIEVESEQSEDSYFEAEAIRPTGEFSGKVSTVSGEVWVVRSNGTRERATPSTILVKGDAVVTGVGGRVEVRTSENGISRVGGNTVFRPDTREHRHDRTAVVGVLG